VAVVVEEQTEAVALEEVSEQDSVSSIEKDDGSAELTDTESQNQVAQSEATQDEAVLKADSADVESVTDAVAGVSVAAADADVITSDELPLEPRQPADADETSTPPDADAIAMGIPRETSATAQPADADTVAEGQQSAAAETLSPLEHWKAARAAVWQGELSGAVTHYQKLITAQPDNYDAYGEMGNVLLAQSNAQAAADAYATAASLIYRSGNRQMAYRVANIVTQLDQARGEVLQGEFAR
jgi:tetratricopeptide (TPR) repeat protein